MACSPVKGMTLIDLLLTLSIIGIMAGFGLPALAQFIDYSRISSETMQLRGTLQLARKAAITEHKKVTICPTSNAAGCSKNWSDGYMAFIDFDENRLFDNNDIQLIQTKIKSKKIKLRWRAFGNRNSLQWHHTGITNHQNGSFEFCFKDKPEFHRALIITKAGRVRLSEDTNGDNIHENARGDNLDC